MKYKKLLNGSFFIMILIIASKLLGLIRDSLIAKSFGLSYLNDIYMFSLGTTMLFISISYGITSALIPIHTYIKENGDIKERNRYISNVITVISIITFIIVALGIVGAGTIVYVFASSFREDVTIYNQAVLLVRVMFISLIFVAVQSILTAVLQCHNRFIATSLMPVFSNTIYILYLIFFIDRYGLNGFGIATVLGFLSMLLINIPGFRKLEYKYNFVFDLKDENLKALGKSMLPIVICASLVQINVFIVRSFAGTLETGSISSLDYANKLNMLVYEVFAQAISMVVYPRLSSLASRSDYKGFNKEISKGINFILLLMVPAAFGLLTLRIPLISLYLERGAFGSNEVIMTSSALIFYIPTMVVYGVRDLVNRGFYSLKESKIPMYNAVLNIILNIIFCFITVKILGVQGLALSNSLATLLATIILIFSLKKKVSSLDISTITRTFIKILIASIVMAIVVNFTNMIFSSYLGTFVMSKLISVLVSTLTGIVIYVILLYVFKIEEFLEYKKIYIQEIIRLGSEDMFKNLDLETFIEDLSSEKPTPGGGSVAALVGALASGLNNMVYSLTINKKAFNNLTDEEQSLVLVSIERTKNLKSEFFKAMEEDKNAFEGLMNAYKLPKATEEEIEIRKKEIEINTIKALEAPLNLARKALELYKEIEIGVKYGNKGAISDAGVSAILTHSTIESAIMNVKINLAYLTNEEFKASVNNEIDNILKESIEKKEMFVGKVYSIIEG